GSPGELVSFSARFFAEDADVGSEQSDIGFDAVNAPIAMLANGTPDCAINPDLSKQPSFTFVRFPACHGTACPCTGTACTAVRAAVFSLASPIGPLPDGATLYTCHVRIAPTASAGQYVLTQDNIVISDPLGLPISGALG